MRTTGTKHCERPPLELCTAGSNYDSETLWNPEYKLDPEELDVLFNRTGLLGKYREIRPDPPFFEVLRWDTVSHLKEIFRDFCTSRGLAKQQLPTGAWEKWHARLMAVSSPPLDPLVPDIRAKDVSIKQSISAAMAGELIKAGLSDVLAKEVSDSLTKAAVESATALLKHIDSARASAVEPAHCPTVIVTQTDGTAVLKLTGDVASSGPDLRLTRAHYDKLWRLWELNRNHRRKLAGLRRAKDVERRRGAGQSGGGGGGGEEASAELAEFHRSAASSRTARRVPNKTKGA